MEMPGLVYGTAWKKAATAGYVAEALRRGFRGIDTACQPRHYHEPGVGEGLAMAYAEGLSRQDLYLQTKYSPLNAQDPERLPYDPAAPIATQVAVSLAVSLENLRTDYLDGLILHSPLATAGQTLEAWHALETVAEAGAAHRIGISNLYSPEALAALCEAATIKPAIVQNRFYRATGYDRELRAFCREQGIVYQSFWTLTANPDLLAHPDLTAIAATHERTPEQTLFRYLTHQGVVPLTGTTSPEHMQQDLAIFGFELDAAEQAAITALLD